MSRVIGILNYKGGTGKTTTVVNLAVGLVLRGARVLCIDLDAQGNLAMYMGVRYRYSLTHLLLGRAQPQTCIVHVRDNLSLIASDDSLLQATGELWRSGDNRRARRVLVSRMRGVEDNYDFVILDFSPSASLLSENGLLYAQELIVPVSTRYMALVGTRQVIQTLKKIGRLPDHRIRLSLILPTFFHPQWRNDREVMEILRRYFADKVAEPIRASVKLAEAPSHHKSIFEYAPDSYGAIDYGLLVERVMQNG